MDGDTRIDDYSKFKAALPANLARYADQLRIESFNAAVSPWILAGIMQRESNAGLALTPHDHGGTGDTHPRRPGTRYASGYVVGPSGMPEDGLGWGRGLMQIDYGVHHEWVTTHDWREPRVNIAKAASILSGFLSFFSTAPVHASAVMVDAWRLDGLHDAKGVTLVHGWKDKYDLASRGPFVDPRPLSGAVLVHAALAAYNANSTGVLEAIAAGLTPDAATSGNDYSNWILIRVNAWELAYLNK